MSVLMKLVLIEFSALNLMFALVGKSGSLKIFGVGGDNAYILAGVFIGMGCVVLIQMIANSFSPK